MQTAFKSLKSVNLNYLELAIILGTSVGLPTMLVGGQLALHYSVPTVLTSILIGNLLLWLIGLAIISITSIQKNIIGIIDDYFGKITGFIFSAVLLFAFILWYNLQISLTSSAVAATLHNELIEQHSFKLSLGICLGLIPALLSIMGLRLIKWACLTLMPILLCYVFYTLINFADWGKLAEPWGISVQGILTVVLIRLPGTINISTFMQHAHRQKDAILALALITFLYSILQFFSALIHLDSASGFSRESQFTHLFYLIFSVVFIFSSYLSINLVNIYFASTGWNKFFVRCDQPLAYFSIGMLGTLIYLVFYGSIYMVMLETLFTTAICTLGVVLILSFLTRTFIKHRLRPMEKNLNTTIWLIGTIFGFGLFALSTNYYLNIDIVVMSIAISFFMFLIIVFLEETIWSAKEIYHFDHKNK